MPFYRFFFGWEGSPTKIDYRKKGALIITSLLEDLVVLLSTVLCESVARHLELRSDH